MNHLQARFIVRVDNLAIRQRSIHRRRPRHKRVESRNRAFAHLLFHVLDPFAFGGVDGNAAAHGLANAPRRSNMIGMRVRQDSPGDFAGLRPACARIENRLLRPRYACVDQRDFSGQKSETHTQTVHLRTRRQRDLEGNAQSMNELGYAHIY
jgi:hypothetical protein